MIGPLSVRRIILCTGPSNSARARYAARRLACGLPDAEVHVFYQTGRGKCGDSTATARRPHGGWKTRYWAARARWKRWGLRFWRIRYLSHCSRRVDRLLSGAASKWAAPFCERSVTTVNDHIDAVRAVRPDALVIFGGAKVDHAVLDAAGVALNIHSGKLPECRGVHSALFALGEGGAECIGATLHLAEAAVDAGDIVRWHPVDPRASPSMHHLLFRLYETGVDLAVDALRRLPHTAIETQPQTGMARFHRMGDVNARVIRAAYINLRRLRRSARVKPGPAGATCCFD